MIYWSNSDSTTSWTSNSSYNDYLNRNSTTTYDNRNYLTFSYRDRINWDYYSTTDTTTTYSPSINEKLFFGTYSPSTNEKSYLDSYYNPQTKQVVVPNPSKEELLRREEERIKAAEVAKKAKEEAEEAARKARILLTEYLDTENLQRLVNKQHLEVPSRLFEDIKYHIPISNGRIKALKENKVITELCLTVKDFRNMPVDDIILTKLLHVLHDEENMLRTANHFNNKEENLLARLN